MKMTNNTLFQDQLSKDKLEKLKASFAEIPFTPMHDHILIMPVQKGVTESGLVIPEDVKMGPDIGIVVKVGPGRRSEDTGQLIPIDVVVGDMVYLQCLYGGVLEMEIDGAIFLGYRARDVVGVLGVRELGSAKGGAS